MNTQIAVAKVIRLLSPGHERKHDADGRSASKTIAFSGRIAGFLAGISRCGKLGEDAACLCIFMRKKLKSALALGLAGAGLFHSQNANAALTTNNITSQASVVADGNLFTTPKRTVYYESPQVNYLDMNGTPIPGGLTNKVVLLYVRNHPENSNVGTALVGGLTINAGSTNTDSGWFRAYYSNSFGMANGEVATNGLNGSSFWTGGIDLTGPTGTGAPDGIVGTYNRNTSDGTWGITYQPLEGMLYYGTPNAPTNAYQFRLNGVPAFPSSGTGPAQIDSIDVIAPWVIPEPSSATLISNMSIVVYNNQTLVNLVFANLLSNVSYAVEVSDGLVSWSPVLSFTATGVVHSVTVTNGSDRGFYRLAK